MLILCRSYHFKLFYFGEINILVKVPTGKIAEISIKKAIELILEVRFCVTRDIYTF